MLGLSTGELPLSFNHIATWVDKTRAGFSDFGVQFLCSQPEVYAACPLRKRLNNNKVCICDVQSHCTRKRVMWGQKNRFYCDPHARQMEISCVTERTACCSDPVDETGTPLSIYSRMAMPIAHPSSHRRNLGLLYSCGYECLLHGLLIKDQT